MTSLSPWQFIMFLMSISPNGKQKYLSENSLLKWPEIFPCGHSEIGWWACEGGGKAPSKTPLVADVISWNHLLSFDAVVPSTTEIVVVFQEEIWATSLELLLWALCAHESPPEEGVGPVCKPDVTWPQQGIQTLFHPSPGTTFSHGLLHVSASRVLGRPGVNCHCLALFRSSVIPVCCHEDMWPLAFQDGTGSFHKLQFWLMAGCLRSWNMVKNDSTYPQALLGVSAYLVLLFF